jgi:TRAP-type mannitol/chloroaromatic compound transport system permease large subunit
MAPKEIGLLDIYRSIWPFVAMMVITVLIVMIFPQVALWLPELVRGG